MSEQSGRVAGKVRVGVVGAAGYVGGEVLGLIARHPDTVIDFAVSQSHTGEALTVAHPDLHGISDDRFVAEMPQDRHPDVLFLCTGHGRARSFLEAHPIDPEVRIIDMSTDFRATKDAIFGKRTFVYGLPERRRDTIRTADAIANPGCFATTIELALLPLADAGLLADDLHIHAVTGSTGAGVLPSATTHFAWRQSNVSNYKPFRHQHLGEIAETVRSLQPEYNGRFRFLPMRGAFTRGIHATVYTQCDRAESDLVDLYRSFYADHPFTFVVDNPPDLKQVTNTNRCHLHVARHDDVVLVTSVTDNLLKGAAGQGVQNMNLMCGLDETAGLQLKGSRF